MLIAHQLGVADLVAAGGGRHGCGPRFAAGGRNEPPDRWRETLWVGVDRITRTRARDSWNTTGDSWWACSSCVEEIGWGLRGFGLACRVGSSAPFCPFGL